jgi:acyl-CoA synthetase (AMP-forming)/AMP-acid ligase II
VIAVAAAVRASYVSPSDLPRISKPSMSLTPAAPTLSDIVARHALNAPLHAALEFLADGEREPARLSYAELCARANAIANELMQRDLSGLPVAVMYPAGPEYLCALLGCFKAGAIAVPAYPAIGQRLRRASERVAAFMTDAGAQVALTTNALAQQFLDTPELGRLECVATDALAPT